MALARNKPYKAKPPLRTVNEIRGILEELDIGTIEFFFLHRLPNVCTVRLAFGDPDLIETRIGTNGKGMNGRYALASAYAEFMERLQNGILIPVRQQEIATRHYLDEHPQAVGLRRALEERDLVLDFLYDPRERYLSAEELCSTYPHIMRAMFATEDVDVVERHLARAFGDTTVVCVPYVDDATGEEVFLPQQIVREVCGSTGMCAGNTRDEALIQGICEVFERYAIRRIYDGQLTPPAVPLELFDGTDVGKRLGSLSKRGLTPRVCDCSLGEGLPVVGLFLEDEATGKCALHLGSDPSPVTALERCLTEVFQGQDENNALRFHLRSESEGLTRRQLLAHYYQQTLSGVGAWPSSIYGDEPSWEFDGFPSLGRQSDADDMDAIRELVASLGSKLLIRDTSWFGFPTYQVYLPGLSENDYVFEGGLSDFETLARFEKARGALWGVRSSSKEEFALLSRAIGAMESEQVPVPLVLSTWFCGHSSIQLQDFAPDYLRALIHACGGDYRLAAQAMDRFLSRPESAKGPLLLYRAQRACWAKLADGEDRDEIEQGLGREFGDGVATRALASDVPASAFDADVFPPCFDCASCAHEGNCTFFAFLRLAKRLKRRIAEGM